MYSVRRSGSRLLYRDPGHHPLIVLMFQPHQALTGNAGLCQPGLVLRRDPAEDGRSCQPPLAQPGIPLPQLLDHVDEGPPGGELVIHEYDGGAAVDPVRQLVGTEPVLRCVAVLLPKEDPISVQRLPGGVDIEAVRPQPGCHGGADGGGRLGKADDQPGLRVLGGHLVPQGTHHLQSRRGAHRDVLGLQGIDQQVAPLGVVVSLGDPQRVCGRIWVHCGTLPSSCHEIVVRL